MPGRARQMVRDDGGHRAHRYDRQPERPLAEAQDKAEKIEGQQEIESQRLRIGDEAAEERAGPAFRDPAEIYRQRQAEIPGKPQAMAALHMLLGSGELRIDEEEEADGPLERRP